VTYAIRVTRPAARDLEARLPEAVATAVVEFVFGPLAENPHRVGKALLPPRAGQHSARRGQYRIIYEIDDERSVVTVLAILHRRDAYHS